MESSFLLTYRPITFDVSYLYIHKKVEAPMCQNTLLGTTVGNLIDFVFNLHKYKKEQLSSINYFCDQNRT